MPRDGWQHALAKRRWNLESGLLRSPSRRKAAPTRPVHRAAAAGDIGVTSRLVLKWSNALDWPIAPLAQGLCMSDPRYQIDVSVVTRYLEAQSDPAQHRYAFAYTITLENTGSVTARLLSRHWRITNGDGEVEEVRGAGVVGQQPTLTPGQSHTYSSGAVLSTAIGFMQGSYEMHAEDGQRFDAPIAAFRLAVPGVLH